MLLRKHIFRTRFLLLSYISMCLIKLQKKQHLHSALSNSQTSNLKKPLTIFLLHHIIALLNNAATKYYHGDPKQGKNQLYHMQWDPSSMAEIQPNHFQQTIFSAHKEIDLNKIAHTWMCIFYAMITKEC